MISGVVITGKEKKIISIIMVFFAIIISISGVNATTVVTSKTVEGNFSNYKGPITLINIATDRLGNLVYIEEYYLIDDSGALKFDKGVKYYDKSIVRDKLTLEIVRPNSTGGRPYSAIMEIVMIDNQTVFQELLKQYKQQTGYQNVRSQNPLIQNTVSTVSQEDAQTKKLPGFELYAAILIISMTYISISKRNQK